MNFVMRNRADEASLAACARRVVTAVFAGFDSDGRFLVLLPDEATPVAALSLVALTAEQAGLPVLVALDTGGLGAPAILGRLLARAVPAVSAAPADSDRLVLRAEREIELRCGEASITLTRAGKVLIRGAHIVSRSKGANKIKGAYVDIN